ncbi:MAG: phospholipase D family protein [Myxococcales bacterium]|nr:phospholipase D family protein [Myxococcales bacterium]
MTDFVREPRSVALELVSGRGHYERVVTRLLSAKRSVWVATANLKELRVEDHRARPGVSRTRQRGSYRSILGVFDELAGKGVELRLLHAGLASGPFRRELARLPRLSGGVGLGTRALTGKQAPAQAPALHMRQCPRVHLKVVVVDGAEVYLGSANFTGAGLGARGEGRRNFELGVMSRDDHLLDEVQALFDHIWRGDACKGCRLRAVCPAPLDQGKFSASREKTASHRRTVRGKVSTKPKVAP